MAENTTDKSHTDITQIHQIKGHVQGEARLD